MSQPLVGCVPLTLCKRYVSVVLVVFLIYQATITASSGSLKRMGGARRIR